MWQPAILPSSVVVNWSAVSLASVSIEYGESTAYGSTSCWCWNIWHIPTKLTNLTDSTSYHFRIRATDIDGNWYYFWWLQLHHANLPEGHRRGVQNWPSSERHRHQPRLSTNVPTTSELEYQPVQVDPKYKATAESNYDNSSVLRSLTPAQL